ncbi:MAG: NADPH-dependent F420 reductase [Alphaproteobacteria bacterium]
MAQHDAFDRARRDFLRLGAGAALFAAARPLAAMAQSAGSSAIKIGVIGSGRLGGTVGSLWVKTGHPVLFSSRKPEELKGLVEGLGALARAGTVAEAIAFGDALLVAIPYGALPQLGRDYGASLAGKIVLDACNAIASRDGDIANEAKEKGVGLTSAKYLPGTRLVRAFNMLSYTVLARDAHRAGAAVAIPIASDDAEALKAASMLVRDAGFDPVVVGGLARASDFATGTPVYLQELTAPEMRQRLSVAE